MVPALGFLPFSQFFNFVSYNFCNLNGLLPFECDGPHKVKDQRVGVLGLAAVDIAAKEDFFGTCGPEFD